MEADWEIEIGPGAPVIEAQWPGFVDLRMAPERAAELPEAAGMPALADALRCLNAPSSPVWTAKCDVWRPDAFDPDELDASPGTGNCAVASYVDLLPRGDRQWPNPGQAAAACEALYRRLHKNPLRCCRADLMVRRACILPDVWDLGVTAYFTACGSTPAEAVAILASELAAFVEAIRS